MLVIPTICGSINRNDCSLGNVGIQEDPIQKITKAKWAARVAELAVCIPVPPPTTNQPPKNQK
jgi:hypothetical protein